MNHNESILALSGEDESKKRFKLGGGARAGALRRLLGLAAEMTRRAAEWGYTLGLIRPNLELLSQTGEFQSIDTTKSI